jgi:hypothetical protein
MNTDAIRNSTRVALSTLAECYCDELAAYVLSPSGTPWAKHSDFTPDMESLARHIQTAIEQWLERPRCAP